jgi:uncharacterized damage-inducible protein DinB
VSVSLELQALLDYSDHERGKWKDWVAADPTRLDLAFQRAEGSRFPTVWSLLEHVFFVERRHLCRMMGQAPPDSSGVARGDWGALFEYADEARADLRRYLDGLTDDQAASLVTYDLQTGPHSLSRRRLAAHIALHEIRHLAQIAYAARLAGHEPPGRHDYFYAPQH